MTIYTEERAMGETDPSRTEPDRAIELLPGNPEEGDSPEVFRDCGSFI